MELITTYKGPLALYVAKIPITVTVHLLRTQKPVLVGSSLSEPLL